MATFTASKPVDFSNLPELSLLKDAATSYANEITTGFTATKGNVQLIVQGSGMTYSPSGPTDGTIDSIVVKIAGAVAYTMGGPLAIDFSLLRVALVVNGAAGVFAQIYAFEDSFVGSTGNDRMFGYEGADTMHGRAGDDFLRGDGGDDRIHGEAGNDRLIGGTGFDTLLGGSGNDKLVGGDWDDYLVGGAGKDTIDGGAGGFDTASYAEKGLGVEIVLKGATASQVKVGGIVEDTIRNVEYVVTGRGADKLTGNAGDNQLTANAGADIVSGGGGQDKLFGGAGADVLNGGSGHDHLSGGGAADVLRGGLGSDHLDGGVGNDKLTGGAGADPDFFDFTTALGPHNVDTLTDFVHGPDYIELSKAIFTKLPNYNALDPQNFCLNAPTAGNDYIIYKQATGQLFYDADGNGSGGAILFAKLLGNPSIDASDLWVIA